jgi:hypothetical protein
LLQNGQLCTAYIVMCLVEYRNYRTAIPMDVRKGVSTETDKKLV